MPADSRSDLPRPDSNRSDSPDSDSPDSDSRDPDSPVPDSSDPRSPAAEPTTVSIPVFSDADCVACQLVEAIAEQAVARRVAVRHPFGSTTAVESFAEIEAPESVTIDDQTDRQIPKRVRVSCEKRGVAFDCVCRLIGLADGKLTYGVELL